MDKRDRHIYWFKYWRWWRGHNYQCPPVIPVHADVTVLDMNGYTLPAKLISTVFMEWNRPKTLHEFICRVLWG